MDDILLTSTLTSLGYTADEIRRQQRSGDLTRLRRGAYTVRASRPTELTLQQQHRRLIQATVAQLREGAVISHASAAVLHDLPVWPAAIQRVHLTRNRVGGGKTRSLVQVHGAPLLENDVIMIGGIAVTSLTRTVLDLCRTLPLAQAVAAGDRALAFGLAKEALEEILPRMHRWSGMPSARRAVGLFDGRSESPGESVSRVRFVELGLPAPEPQYRILDAEGEFVARVDFGWDEQRTVGEFDGQVKYGRMLRPGEPIEDVLFEEKKREDAIRELGWKIVRWIWADLYHPRALRDRVLAAFARR